MKVILTEDDVKSSVRKELVSRGLLLEGVEYNMEISSYSTDFLTITPTEQEEVKKDKETA